jgi:hypothetical protein
MATFGQLIDAVLKVADLVITAACTAGRAAEPGQVAPALRSAG